jgi:LEA14-like dessication related protein
MKFRDMKISSTHISKRWPLVATAFVFMLSSCTVYKDVEVKQVVDVKLTEFGGNGVEAEVYLSISNPNWYKVTLTESHINLFFEGKPLGEVELQEPLEIPKQAVSTQVLKVQADMDNVQDLLGNVLQMLFKSEFKLEAKGYVQGKALFVAKKVPVEFKETLSREDLGF